MRIYCKNIYICIYYMVIGYGLGYIKVLEYFMIGMNIICICIFLNIFFLFWVIELCYLYNK